METLARGRTDLVTALLGAWIVTGGALDAYAHQRTSLDSFFTPWHAILYSGFAATAIWIIRMAKSDRSKRHRLSLIGLATFAAGAVGDLVWHSIFGVEQQIGAATSPTHLVLFIGAAMILSSPLRAAWRRTESPSGAVLVAATLSVASLTMLASLLLYFLSPFVFGDVGATIGANARAGIAGFLLSTLVYFTPVILLRLRWSMPFGVTTFLLGGVATVSGFAAGTARGGEIVAAWLAAVAIDAIGSKAPRARNWNVFFGAFAPVVFWGAYMAARALGDGIAWEAELWTGSIVLSGLLGAGIVFVATALPRDAPAPRSLLSNSAQLRPRFGVVVHAEKHARDKWK